MSCRIIIDKIDDVLYIPLDAVNREGESTFVYKKSGGGYNKTEVETGINNTDYIVILDGLKEGDDIALINPFEEESTEEPDNTVES